MERTVADTIREITRSHLNNGGLLLGQAITAVGYVNNTVPEDCLNIVELPMCDVAGAGFAVGTAIVGRRPILVIRFQDFMFLDGSMLVNYAAKSKEVFGQSCPIFIRAISAEGHGIGIVHSACLHSIFTHIPGMRVYAPMTPREYEGVWSQFMQSDEPFYVSEHRRSYNESQELETVIRNNADVTIYAISAARFSATIAVEFLKKTGIKCNLVHVFQLKPLCIPYVDTPGLVVDSDYETSGLAQSIAYKLMLATGQKVTALGRRDRSTGVGQHLENATPTAGRIVETVRRIVNGS